MRIVFFISCFRLMQAFVDNIRKACSRGVQPVGPLAHLCHDTLLSITILIPETTTGWWTRVRAHPGPLLLAVLCSIALHFSSAHACNIHIGIEYCNR